MGRIGLRRNRRSPRTLEDRGTSKLCVQSAGRSRRAGRRPDPTHAWQDPDFTILRL